MEYRSKLLAATKSWGEFFAREMNATHTPIIESNRSADMVARGDIGEIAAPGVPVGHA